MINSIKILSIITLVIISTANWAHEAGTYEYKNCTVDKVKTYIINKSYLYYVYFSGCDNYDDTILFSDSKKTQFYIDAEDAWQAKRGLDLKVYVWVGDGSEGDVLLDYWVLDEYGERVN